MIPADEIKLPDRFRIDQEIGRGGMAVVYRAHDRHLDRFVAIKVLSPHLSHAMGVERFQREIALMAKLVHPGIVASPSAGAPSSRISGSRTLPGNRTGSRISPRRAWCLAPWPT